MEHHIFDDFEDPTLPAADVVFMGGGPARWGLQASFVQGHRMFLERIERATYRNPAPKVCIAKWLVDVGLAYGVPAAQLWHVPMGMDHDLFAMHNPLDQRPIDVAMLFHPHREKGWDVGIQVLETLRARRPEARLAVFSRARRPELPDGVEFFDSLAQHELVETVYNRTKIFVQSSHNEGFGFTAPEAMACGAALVTTDNGGSRDYAVANETALVVPPGDVLGLVGMVETLIDDDALRHRIAHAGERYVRRFDWDLGASILEEKLEQYVADPAAFQQPPAPDGQADYPLAQLVRDIFEATSFDPPQKDSVT